MNRLLVPYAGRTFTRGLAQPGLPPALVVARHELAQPLADIAEATLAKACEWIVIDDKEAIVAARLRSKEG